MNSAPLTLFIGQDVHNDSIAVSIAPGDSTEVRRYGLIGGTHDDVLKLAKKLAAAHPQATLKFCYEAGPHGHPLGRFLQSHGYECIIVAPSKVPRRPGTVSKPTAAMPINWPACIEPGNFAPSTSPIRRTKRCGILCAPAIKSAAGSIAPVSNSKCFCCADPALRGKVESRVCL
jgi:hypothetical protein